MIEFIKIMVISNDIKVLSCSVLFSWFPYVGDLIKQCQNESHQYKNLNDNFMKLWILQRR